MPAGYRAVEKTGQEKDSARRDLLLKLPNGRTLANRSSRRRGRIDPVGLTGAILARRWPVLRLAQNQAVAVLRSADVWPVIGGLRWPTLAHTPRMRADLGATPK